MVPVPDVSDAVSPFTAWKSACMSWRTSLLMPLVADVEPSLSPSLSVDPDVWLAALLPLAGCGIDRPRLCSACIMAWCI